MNTLTILLSIVLSQSGLPAQRSAQWPSVAYRPAAVRSVKATKAATIRAAKPAAPAKDAASNKVRIASADPLPEDQLNVYDPTLAPYREIRALLDSDKTQVAVKLMEGVIESNPGWSIASPTAGLLADGYLRQGRNYDAFRVLQPFLASGVEGAEDVIVRASLAAALMGRRYPMQEEYVVRHFRKWEATLPLASIANDQDRLIYLSAVANCVQREYNGKQLWSALKALEVAPGDPLATYLAVDILLARRQISRARALLTRARESSDDRLNGGLRSQSITVEMLGG